MIGLLLIQGHPQLVTSYAMSYGPLPEIYPRASVILDAGHGGKDAGALGHGLVEKDLALTVTLLVADELTRRDISYHLTRSDDTFLELADRAITANRHRSDLLVSIHFNTGPKEARGVESFYSPVPSWRNLAHVRDKLQLPVHAQISDERSRHLSAIMLDHAAQATGALKRKSMPRDLALTVSPSCPSVLIECGFLTNPAEASHLRQKLYLAKLARGLADGIESYLLKTTEDPRFGIEIEPQDTGLARR
jgi:N-acetylmuramoyl-L-alanine amidase